MRELWEARELLWSFTLRELSVRYKQSFLGALWAVIQPLSLMLVFTIFFSRLAQMPSDGLPYPLFSFSALLPWSFFTGALSQAIPSLATNSDLINKVYFPRMVIPLSSILVAGADFLVSSLVFLGMMVFYHVPLTWNALYIFPLLMVEGMFMAGVCLFFSGLNVFYRDIRYALPLVLQLWIYAVPVLYSMQRISERYPQYRRLYTFDPMAVVVDGFRQCLAKGQAPLASDMLVASLAAALVLFLGVRYFRWVEQAFADIV